MYIMVFADKIYGEIIHIPLNYTLATPAQHKYHVCDVFSDLLNNIKSTFSLDNTSVFPYSMEIPSG